MIDVATLSVIRRWALREQMSIREIAGDEEPRYAKRANSSKLAPYAEKLSIWLAIEATKTRKQRRNLRQIHTLNLIAKAVGLAISHRVIWRQRSRKARLPP